MILIEVVKEQEILKQTCKGMFIVRELSIVRAECFQRRSLWDTTQSCKIA